MKLNKIDIFLAAVFALVIAFVIAMIVVFARYQSVPDSLVAGVFGLAGGECGILGWVKSSNEKTRQRQWEVEDRKEDKKEAKAKARAEAKNKVKEESKDEAVG